ncbi:MAG: DUF3509 domain-containing protein [Pseudomonas sp.]|uniref:DUF3509 domain-containing protein n=1 Tax=Pseudomonas sp. TaxID=306 RepID=UPI003392F9DE
MNLVLEANLAFSAAFPDFDIATQIRPDGGLLLTLHAGDRIIAKRSLPFGQFNSPLQLEWQISAIRRDLALDAAMAPAVVALQSHSRGTVRYAAAGAQ